MPRTRGDTPRDTACACDPESNRCLQGERLNVALPTYDRIGATVPTAVGRSATVDDRAARVQTRRSLNGHEQPYGKATDSGRSTPWIFSPRENPKSCLQPMIAGLGSGQWRYNTLIIRRP